MSEPSYASWRVGMRALCIADAIGTIQQKRLYPLFKKGQIFTVASLETIEGYGLFLGFEECHPDHTGHHSGFRPLVSRPTSIAIFTAMLTKKHERILEEAK